MESRIGQESIDHSFGKEQLVRTFLEKLHDFFFSDTELEEFLVFRFLFYICSLPYIAFHYLQAFWDFPPHFQSPILIHGLLPFPPVSGSTAPFLYLLIFVTALLAALGLGGAFVRSIFFLSALYVFGNRYCFGVRLGQVDSPLIICAFLFIFARCVQSSASWEYCWPRRCVQLLLVLVIWEAGIAKIRSSGFDWISHEIGRAHV